jgi:hypothetical protein
MRPSFGVQGRSGALALLVEHLVYTGEGRRFEPITAYRINQQINCKTQTETLSRNHSGQQSVECAFASRLRNKLPGRPVADAFAGAVTRGSIGTIPETAETENTQQYREVLWLPFLDTYRTMCLAPQPDFRRVLEDVRAMQLAA